MGSEYYKVGYKITHVKPSTRLAHICSLVCVVKARCSMFWIFDLFTLPYIPAGSAFSDHANARRGGRWRQYRPPTNAPRCGAGHECWPLVATFRNKNKTSYRCCLRDETAPIKNDKLSLFIRCNVSFKALPHISVWEMRAYSVWKRRLFWIQLGA